MPERSKEEIDAIKDRNNARARKMGEGLDALHEKAAETIRPQYNPARLDVSKSRRMKVSVSINIRRELQAVAEKYGLDRMGDLEVQTNIDQRKPDHWYEHVSGPWTGRPVIETKTVPEALIHAMFVHKWSKELEDFSSCDYDDITFSFECDEKIADVMTREVETQLRAYAIEFLALAELCAEIHVKEDAEDERRCDEHNAYMALPGAVFTESRRSAKPRGRGESSHYDCVVKNPASGRPRGHWGSTDGADQDDVLFKTQEGPHAARQWLAKYLKAHPEIKAPKDMYETKNENDTEE
jgi:hypothetical protein